LLLDVPTAKRNRLLAKLPEKYRKRFIDECDTVDLEFEKIVAETGKRIAHVYFPLEGFISQITPTDGSKLELGLVGNEGMFGLPLGLGVPTSNVRGMVQGGGAALRMSAAAFRRHLESNADMRKQIGLYTFVTISQLGQTVACNRFHVVEQRLARWLLMTADRAHSPTFAITHAFLAYMLGVRRVGVTVAALALQKHGLIRYSRGKIAVLDRKGLEAASCSCYRSDLAIYKKVFG
jgi:CRP-like cAMP-binding protein